jgi:hypothetical protein
MHYSPMKMEQTECSETLALKLQTPVNRPAESTRHSEQSESLKSGIMHYMDQEGKKISRL